MIGLENLLQNGRPFTEDDKDSINSCLFLLKNLQNNVIAKDNTQKNEYVYFCYSNEDKEIVLEIKRRFLPENIETWLYEINAGAGSQLETIAEAVEKAYAFIIFFSEKSKRNLYCRISAEYAIKLNKPMLFVKVQKGYNPDGWLGLILGQNFIYDTTLDEVGTNENIARLMAHTKVNLPSLSDNESSPIREKDKNPKSRKSKKSKILPQGNKNLFNGLFTCFRK